MAVNRLKKEILTFPTPEQTFIAVADRFSTAAKQACQSGGRFTIVLAGGETPRALYRLLATAYRDQFDWQRVYVFFSDERFVPHADPLSNYRMIKETLLDSVPIPEPQIYPMPTEGVSLEQAALQYEAQLLSFFQGPPCFDWVLLGLGEDGHTASLFPGQNCFSQQWVAAVADAPKPPPQRLTLTYQTFNQSMEAVFLATGSQKAKVVANVLQAPETNLPAQKISPKQRLAWYIDEAAAGLLKS
ncbi:MAG: hypothetical protein AXA67_07605 [Methylothermaceae bacteria B42]|nr:MAG: hypothetical protein AXA67_07605 [Methylothermaceae bacteria B42]HHJ40109.1 6-phosphogluconolactonase [Methylothermaceae bacterium]